MTAQTPQAIVDNRSDYYTLFTKSGGTSPLVSVPQWTKITLRLETAGPVSIGTRDQLDPVSSGKGRVLPTGEDVIVTLGPNTRFYYAAIGVHRVSVHVESFPWLQAIHSALLAIANALTARSGVAPAPDPSYSVSTRRC